MEYYRVILKTRTKTKKLERQKKQFDAEEKVTLYVETLATLCQNEHGAIVSSVTTDTFEKRVFVVKMFYECQSVKTQIS